MNLVLQVSGALPETALYVPRAADLKLPAAMMRGEFCYLLAPRQIGKSSLRVRARRNLERNGVRCVTIDLTAIGLQAAREGDWYFDLLEEAARQLGLADPQLFWHQHQLLSPVHRWSRFWELALRQIAEPIAVFIDEIDAIRVLPDGIRDDFFSSIRAFYNWRAEDAAYQRLTFCLFGVAVPSELIHDEKRTPFNIGCGVILEDFTLDEMKYFLPALQWPGSDPAALLQEIFRWTNGHPYMTQKLCLALAEQQSVGPAPAAVAGLVRELFLQSGRVYDANLAAAEKCFQRSASEPLVVPMLKLYQRLVNKECISAVRQDQVQLALRMTGMVSDNRSEDRIFLQPRNAIFSQVFNLDWLTAREADRLLTEPLSRWLHSGRRAELLLPTSLVEAAQKWAHNRHDVTAEERDFIIASLVQHPPGAEKQQLAKRLAASQRAQAEINLQRWISGSLLALVLVLAATSAHLWHGRAQDREPMQSAEAEPMTDPAPDERPLLIPPSVTTPAVARSQAQPIKSPKRKNRLRDVDELALPINAPAAPPSTDFRLAAAYVVPQSVGDIKCAELQEVPQAWVDEALDGARRSAESREASHAVMSQLALTKVLAAAPAELGAINLRGHMGKIRDSAFSPDGRLLVTAGADHVARLWQIPSGALLHTLYAHTSDVLGVSFSTDAQRILTRSYDNTVGVWDASTARMLIQLRGHSNLISSAEFLPNGRRIVTASADYSARVWDIETGKDIVRVKFPNPVLFATPSPDGERVLSGEHGDKSSGVARVWRVESGVKLRDLFIPNYPNLRGGNFSRDGRLFAIAANNSVSGEVITVDTQTGRVLQPPIMVPSGAWQVLFSPASDIIATGISQQVALLWSPGSHAARCAFKNRSVNRLRAGNFTPDGRSLITVDAAQSLRLWDVQTCAPLAPPPSSKVDSALFSPDADWLLTTEDTGVAHLLPFSARAQLQRVCQLLACRPEYAQVKSYCPEQNIML